MESNNLIYGNTNIHLIELCPKDLDELKNLPLESHMFYLRRKNAEWIKTKDYNHFTLSLKTANHVIEKPSENRPSKRQSENKENINITINNGDYEKLVNSGFLTFEDGLGEIVIKMT